MAFSRLAGALLGLESAIVVECRNANRGVQRTLVKSLLLWTFPTKSRMDCFAPPSFQEGSWPSVGYAGRPNAVPLSATVDTSGDRRSGRLKQNAAPPPRRFSAGISPP